MGRPRVSSERRVATAVRLPESLYARLHAVANERDVSVNHIVTRAVGEILDRLEGSDPLALRSGRSDAGAMDRTTK